MAGRLNDIVRKVVLAGAVATSGLMYGCGRPAGENYVPSVSEIRKINKNAYEKDIKQIREIYSNPIGYLRNKCGDKEEFERVLGRVKKINKENCPDGFIDSLKREMPWIDVNNLRLADKILLYEIESVVAAGSMH